MKSNQKNKIFQEIAAKSSKNGKMDLELFHALGIERINFSSGEVVRKIREELKVELRNIDLFSKKVTSTEKRKFLKNKRNMVTKLLAHTKERLRLINLVVCNSVSLNTAERFLRIASQVLPTAEFQNILGKCMTEDSIEQDKLGFIKEFMKDLDVGNR